MEPQFDLGFFEDYELLGFLRCNKTSISIMEKPKPFIRQLRDHNLIREDKYEKLNRMKRDNMDNGLYDELDWLEQHTPQHIRLFWECVFKESILSLYPTLEKLRMELVDRKRRGEGGKKESGSIPGDSGEDVQQPGTSSSSTPGQIKKNKSTSSSPRAKAKYKDQILIVTCGEKTGMLYTAKLAKGRLEKCIAVKGLGETARSKWFTPFGFQEYGGRKDIGNWKLSIRCAESEKTLGTLLKDGDLPRPGSRARIKKEKKKSVPPGEEEQQPATSSSSTPAQRKEKPTSSSPRAKAKYKDQIPVTCGEKTGMLYTAKLAKGRLEKCIAVKGLGETARSKWFTPFGFQKYGGRKDIRNWKLSIRCAESEKTLGTLLKDGDLPRPGSRARIKKDKKKSVPPGEEEQPTTSSSSTPAQRKEKPTSSSPRAKAKYKDQIPVTCGEKKGMLYTAKLAKGRRKKCISVKGLGETARSKWFTPFGFQKYGGRKDIRNWKLSIRCAESENTLKTLLKDGDLPRPGSSARIKKEKKKSVSPGEDKQQPGTSSPSTPAQRKEKPIFSSPGAKAKYKDQIPVTCGKKKGMLYTAKLAKGSREKCIAVKGLGDTARSKWYTPSQFQEYGGRESSNNWKLSIRCAESEKTLGTLLKDGDLPHPGSRATTKKPQAGALSKQMRWTVSNRGRQAAPKTIINIFAE